jgi:hypothetical protein
MSIIFAMSICPHVTNNLRKVEWIFTKFGNFINVCPYRFWLTIGVLGRAIAQAVIRRLPTAVAPVRTQVRSCGICGGQSGTGAGFLRVLRFPLPILISPNTPHSLSSIIRGSYNRPISGGHTKWTQSHPTTRNNNKRLSVDDTKFWLRSKNKGYFIERRACVYTCTWS